MALLELYVARDRRGNQSLVIVHDFDRKHEQAPPGPNRVRRGGQATRGNGTQIMDGEIGRGYSFVGFKLRYYCECGCGID